MTPTSKPYPGRLCEGEIAFASRDEARDFTIGEPIYWLATPRRRWLDRIRRLLWWRKNRGVVSAIDVVRGTITLTEQRWSWRGWRWEGPR